MAALLPSRVFAGLGSALRSWRREEQRPLARRRLPQLLFWLSAAGLLGLTGLALRSQIAQQHETRLAERQEALSILLNRAQHSLQTVGDWGHWNEMHAYVDARDPTFLDVNIRRSSLLQSEGVMVVFDRRQAVLFSADRHGLNAPGHRSLIDCLRPDLAGLRHVEDSRVFLCDGSGGEPHVGSILPISDSSSARPANGTIAFLLPLRAAGSAARSLRVMNQLLADLRPAPRNWVPPASANLVSLHNLLGQPLLTPPNRQVLLRRPSPWEGAAGPLRTALAGVVLGSWGALALRMVWMLERRRQRLAECRQQISRRLQQRRHRGEQHRRQIEQKLSSSLTAAAVAHEIQQPLSTILLHCRLALQDLNRSAGQDGPAEAGTARELRLAQRLASLSVEAQRAAQITETMRMLLRNVNTPHHPVNLQTVVDSSLLFFRRPLSDHGIRLETHGLDQPTLLTGDATQLQSALNNLIQNAITAMAVDGSCAGADRIAIPSVEACGKAPSLRIALHHGGDQIHLIVADSGPGFAHPERAMAQSGSSCPGCGLGLFVVRTTMENHGGSLHIGRSAELGGAEVQLRWPCPPAPHADPVSGTGGQAEPEGQDAEGAEHHNR